MPIKSIIVQKYYKFLPGLMGGFFLLPATSWAIPPQISPQSLLAQYPATPLPPPRVPADRPFLPPPPAQPYTPSPLPDSRLPASRYTVYINGDSPLLLQIVRKVEPAASIWLYKKRRVIDGGTFSNESDAQQRVAQLQSLGVRAQITNYHDGEEFSALVPSQQPSFPPVQGPPLPSAPQGPMIPGSGLYQVLVDSGNASLRQVRQIEPKAFIRQSGGRRVIQAGSFTEVANAQRRADVLVSRGITARIVRGDRDIESVPNQSYSAPVQPYIPPVPPTQTYVTPVQPYIPPAQNLPPSNPNYYFVAISTNRLELANLTQQLLGLGVPANQVVTKDLPGDPHVAVGPFSDRQLAEQWQRYLKEAGVKNSRVYFGR